MNGEEFNMIPKWEEDKDIEVAGQPRLRFQLSPPTPPMVFVTDHPFYSHDELLQSEVRVGQYI